MKILSTVSALSIIVCLGALTLHAQINLTITSIDAALYPNVKVYFKASDAAGNRFDTFSLSNFTVIENGIPRTVISVNCPLPPPQSVSLTLTFDISSSMQAGNRMTNAKNAAQTLINQFSFPPAECGITTFHSSAAVFLPYTTNKSSVLTAISNLQANGAGTDLFKGFMDPIAGSIPFTQIRSGKRAVIFLTDAYEILTTAEVNQIIAAANANNIVIYTIAVIPDPPFPYPLRTIATGTGGKWYEGVVTEQQAIDVYKQIATDILNPPPCELVYQSSGCDLDRSGTITLTLAQGSNTQNISYSIPPASPGRLAASKFYLEYSVVQPPRIKDLQVTLTARNKTVTVQSIAPDKSQFTVTSFGGSAPPFTLAPNQSRIITVQFAPTDLSRITSSLVIVSDAACNAEVLLAGGKVIPPPLAIVKPNGGEQLNVASNYQIEWTGISPSEQVTLEYTTDAGDNWSLITGAASGLLSGWSVPNTPGNKCLMRVTTSSKRNSPVDKILLPWHGDRINTVAFAQDGSMLASGSSDKFIRLWRPDNGALLQILSGHTNTVRSIAFNQDSGWFASGSNDRSVRIWKMDDGSLLRTLPLHQFGVHTVFVRADGVRLLTSDERDIKMWRTSDFSLDWNLAGYSDVNGSAAISPNGKFIASVRGNNAFILDATNGNPLKTLTGHSNKVRTVSFSPDGSLIATGGDDRTVRIWRVSDGQQIETFSGHSAEVNSVMFSYDGSVVLSASNDKTLIIWQVLTNQILVTLSGHDGSVISGVFSPDRKLIASGSSDKTVRLWGYDAPMSDRSDSLWTIISASATITTTTPTFKTLICANELSFDTTIEVANTGNQSLTITEAQITGNNAADFQLMTPASIPPIIILPPGQKRNFTLRFKPTGIGARNAALTLKSNSLNNSILDIPLTAIKDSVGVTISSSSIDFGERYECSGTMTQSFHIQNTGSQSLVLPAAAIDDTTAYSIDSPLFPLTLDPGKDTLITIVFNPTQERSYATVMHLIGLPCALSPSVQLTGSRRNSGPDLSDTLLDFGPVSIGQFSVRSLTIRNMTTSNMRIAALALLAPDVTILNPPNFPYTIAPNDSLVLNFEYRPTIDGTLSEVLGIQIETPCDETVDVQLNGRASTKPLISATTPTIKTLLCPADSATGFIIDIENKGGQPLVISQMLIEGAFAADYTLINPLSVPPAIQLNPSQKTSITIRFSPRGIGIRSSSLKIVSNSSSDSALVIPLNGRREIVDLILSASSIDFGEKYECSSPDTKTIIVRNPSGVPITLDSATTSGSAFQLTSPLPVVINPFDSLQLQVTYAPTMIGGILGSVTLHGSPCAIRRTISLSGMRVSSLPLLSSSTIDFGSVGVGRTQDGEITWTNPLTVQITIDSFAVSDTTSLSLSMAIISLSPGSLGKIVLRYAPTQSETLSRTFLIYQGSPCSNIISIILTGRSTQATATVSLPSLSARIGETIMLPITLSNPQNFVQSGVKSFRTELIYNRTMLWPERVLGPNGGTGKIISNTSQGDTAHLTIEVTEQSIPTSGVIANVEFLVLLGNAEVTPLGFASFQWLNGVATSTTLPGSFTAEGICRAGGNRLIGTPKTLTLWQNNPNPFNPTTTIEYYLPVEGHVRLDVFNSAGKTISTLVDTDQGAGIHTVIFDVSQFGNLTSGMYSYRLQSAGQVLVKRMILLK